jgi:hypothetical protein
MVWGSNPSGDKIFCTCPDRPWGPTSLLYNGYWVFPGGKERPGRDADPSPPSSAMVMKGYSYTSTLPMGCTACTEPQCLYKGAFTYLILLPYTQIPSIVLLKGSKQLQHETVAFSGALALTLLLIVFILVQNTSPIHLRQNGI